MHPNPAFRWRDEAAMRAFVSARGFAHLCIDGPAVAHVPVVVTDQGTLRFHLARSNRIAGRIEGARAIASVTDADHYVSPDWYGSPDQVPTWNYCAVEIEGVVCALDDGELAGQIDALSAVFEATLAPKPAWTRAKMTPGRAEAMIAAIRGFELVPEEWRGTAKLGQNKSAADREGLAQALRANGRAREAAMVSAGAPA